MKNRNYKTYGSTSRPLTLYRGRKSGDTVFRIVSFGAGKDASLSFAG
jgi:hypothetical protein